MGFKTASRRRAVLNAHKGLPLIFSLLLINLQKLTLALCGPCGGKNNVSAGTSEIFSLPGEHKIHIFGLTCNLLFIIWTINIHGRG